jgi:hypothetical protein
MTYLHHLPGRVRIRAAGLKRNPARGRALKQWLESLPGVSRVEVNPVTGSVLIHYCIGATDGNALIAKIREHGWITGPVRRPAEFTSSAATRQAREAAIEDAVMKLIVRYLAEMAVERSILALLAAIL